MNTATRRFQNVSAIMRELNQAGHKMQTVNDLLTGAASQHALRTTFVPETEARSLDTEIVAYCSQLAGRDVTSPLFHLPLRMGGLGLGSAVQRHTAAPMDSLAINHPHPNGRHRHSRHGPPVCGNAHPARPASPPPNQTRPPNEHTLHPPGTSGRTAPHTWHPKNTGQRHPAHNAHRQLTDTHADTPIQRAILNSQTAKKQRCPPPAAQQQRTRSGRQMLSRSHWRNDSCLHTQLRACQPTSHPRAQTSVHPSEFAPAPSMPVSSTA